MGSRNRRIKESSAGLAVRGQRLIDPGIDTRVYIESQHTHTTSNKQNEHPRHL